MLKDYAWKLFEQTGNIEAYVFYKELDKREEQNKELNTEKQEVAISC